MSRLPVSPLLLAVGLSLPACHLGSRGPEPQGELQGTHDFAHIARVGKMGHAAYMFEEVVREWFGAEPTIHPVQKHDMRYLYWADDGAGVQVLSIRGSTNFNEYMLDAEFIRHVDRDLGVPVHQGFDRGAWAVLEDALPRLDRSRPIRLTGHSLGGAVAVLVALHLKAAGFTIEEVITLGQPKVTNAEGVKAFSHLPLLRIVDEHDVIISLPPSSHSHPEHGGYGHFGEELLLLDGPHYVWLSEREAEHPEASGFWSELDESSMHDHQTGVYIERIEAKIDGAVAVPFHERHRYMSKD